MSGKGFSKVYSQPWIQVVVLVGFCFFLYLFNLGRWDLWGPDEHRYAQVAKEIVNRGDWIFMYYNGKTYADKPPLFFWLIAFSSFLWHGFSSFSVRFPAAFFGTLTVLLTFFLGKILYSSRTGFFSGLILATSLEFSYLSTRANIDTTLTFFTTASLLCFFLWYRRRSTPLSSLTAAYRQAGNGEMANLFSKGGKRDLIIYGFYIGMALATLTKGPVGFILPFSVSFVYLVVQKDWSGMRRMRLLSGMALFLVVVLVWYLPAVSRGGTDYLKETLLHHSIDRFTNGIAHIRPIYYYLHSFPSNFLPWTFFLPAAIFYGFSKKMGNEKNKFLFLLTWIIVTFLFFSFSKGKRTIYLLPLYPAISIVVGKLWHDLIFNSMEHFRKEWVSFPLYISMGLALLVAAAIPWVVSVKFPPHLFYSLPFGLLFAGGGVMMFVLHRFKCYGAIFFLLTGIAAGSFFYTLRVVFPLANPYRSARFLCREITLIIQPGEKLATFSLETGPYNYYTGIVPISELEDEEALCNFLRSRERVFCLIRLKNVDRIQARVGLSMVKLVDEHRLGYKDILLISNR